MMTADEVLSQAGNLGYWAWYEAQRLMKSWSKGRE